MRHYLATSNLLGHCSFLRLLCFRSVSYRPTFLLRRPYIYCRAFGSAPCFQYNNKNTQSCPLSCMGKDFWSWNQSKQFNAFVFHQCYDITYVCTVQRVTYILIIVSQAHFDGFLCYSMFISKTNVIIVIRTPQACEELIRQTLFLLFERVVCLLKSGRIRKG